MFPVLREALVPGLGTLTGSTLVKLLDRMPLEDSDLPGRENCVVTVRSVEEFQDESEGIRGLCGVGGEGICC